MPPKHDDRGHCTCRTHVDRPWNRSEHWSAAEVAYLEQWFGMKSDEDIARKLKRSVLGIRLKAKRLGLKKKDAGYTARELGRQFGIDPTVITKSWVRRGLIEVHRAYYVGLNLVNLFDHSEVERFIAEQGHWIDHEKVPTDSVFADQVAANRWYSLPQLHRLTGRSNLDIDIRDGILPARKKGSHWMVAEADIAGIRRLPPAHASESFFRREQVLRVRRDRRKGLAA